MDVSWLEFFIDKPWQNRWEKISKSSLLKQKESSQIFVNPKNDDLPSHVHNKPFLIQLFKA